MITGKINLAALTHAKVKSKKGADCIMIPIEANKLFLAEKSGAVYLDLVAFDMKEPKEYSTHIIKQSLSKEDRESMSKEDQNAMPILGNLNASTGDHRAANNEVAAEFNGGEDNDLPF